MGGECVGCVRRDVQEAAAFGEEGEPVLFGFVEGGGGGVVGAVALVGEEFLLVLPDCGGLVDVCARGSGVLAGRYDAVDFVTDFQ